MEKYRPKSEFIEAEHLKSDAMVKTHGNKEFYIFGGDYLIKAPEGKIFPVEKDLFEFLFEKEEK